MPKVSEELSKRTNELPIDMLGEHQVARALSKAADAIPLASMHATAHALSMDAHQGITFNGKAQAGIFHDNDGDDDEDGC